MIEWDLGGVMVKNVCLNGTVKKVTTNKTKVSINGRSSASNESPGFGGIVWQSNVGMLKECNRD
jgi:hypothetical protein